MKLSCLFLFSILSLNAFAVDVSHVPFCKEDPKKPNISEELQGEFWAQNEYISENRTITTSELFRIQSDKVSDVPQLYSVNGNHILEDVEKYYCISITAKDKEVKDSLKIKLIAKHKNRLSTDKTTITYWLRFNADTGEYSWKYKISDKSFILFLLPVGSSLWSYDYKAGKVSGPASEDQGPLNIY